MGPMGVAVGIAIDEGIEKTINETAQAGGFNAKVIVQQRLNEQTQNSVFDTPIKNCTEPELILNEINLSNVTGGAGGQQLSTIDAKMLVTAPSCNLYVRSINKSSHKSEVVTAELGELKTKSTALSTLFEG